jgi:hypothetical protein
MDHAWEVLRPGGALLVDDLYQNMAFHEFVEAVRPRWTVVGANADGSYRFGIILKEGDLAEALMSGARHPGALRPAVRFEDLHRREAGHNDRPRAARQRPGARQRED